MQYQCDICLKSYSTNFNRLKHIRKTHNQAMYLKKSNIHCVECKKTFKYLKDLRSHLTIDHDVEECTTNHNFKTFAEFKAWKRKEEISKCYRYVVIRGAVRLANGAIKKEFACHRSGFEKHQVEKPLKRQCSYKLNAVCPACIEIVIYENGSVDATFYRTHIDHSKEVKYLAISREERAVIGTKLVEGYSFTEILEHVRSLDDNGELSARFLKLTRKDLHNIKNYFQLQDTYELDETSGEFRTVPKKRSIQIDRKFIERDIQRSHKLGYKIGKKEIVPHSEKPLVWNVRSHEVELLKPIMCDCDVTCPECKICIHMLRCNCYEMSFNESTICSHIHGVVNQYFLEKNSMLLAYLNSEEVGRFESTEPLTKELETVKLVEIERLADIESESYERTAINEDILQDEENIIVYSLEFDGNIESEKQVSYLNFLECSLDDY